MALQIPLHGWWSKMWNMALVCDMVWAVATPPLASRGYPSDRVHMECDPLGIWLEDAHGEVVAGVWRMGWWEPSTVANVMDLADELLDAVSSRREAHVTRRKRKHSAAT